MIMSGTGPEAPKKTHADGLARALGVLYLKPYYSRGSTALTSIEEGFVQAFIISAGLSTGMASAEPRAIRRSGGMNRWTLEPLFSVVYILLLATGVLVVALAAAGLGFALVVVTLILLWAAVVVVWSRRSAAKGSR
jgi:hypothetical protein